MNPKAIKHLANLSDPEFFKEISTGLELVHENSARLAEEAELLGEQKRWAGCRALKMIAEEEAAKYLILLDAVRCPRGDNDQRKLLSRHLGSFNDHLAKGIYPECCGMQFGSVDSARRYVEYLRPALYLDGAEGFEWIFRNRVLQEREDKMYVSYVDFGEGEEHSWTSPSQRIREEAKFGALLSELELPSYSRILKLVSALHDVGVSDHKALEIIASIWRPLEATNEPKHSTQLRKFNTQTLEALDTAGLLREQPQTTYETVVSAWMVPLYSLNLRVRQVDKSHLKERQRELIANWEAAQWG